jgi:hypothetical protein
MDTLIQIAFGRVLPWGFVLAGGVYLVIALRNVARAKASADWPSVRGIIRQAEVRRETDRKGLRYFGAQIVYDYEINGLVYTSSKVSFGDYSSGNPAHADEIVAQYPVGAQVRVYYDPAAPRVAVLETGIRGAAWLMAAICAVFIIAGIWMMIFLPERLGMN